MSRRRTTAVLTGTLLLAALGCTGDPADEPDGVPTPHSPASQSESEPGSSKPTGEQPVVLLVHATDGRPGLSLEDARRVLRGAASSAAVVAAPGMPVGQDVAVLDSATDVVRRVQRGGALGVVPAAAVRPAVRPLAVDGVHPMRDPEAYPLAAPGPAPPEPTTLTVVGDVMLARGVVDPAAALRPMSGRLGAADITVGNLEGTLSTEGPPQQGGDSFGATPAVLGPLTRAGFDALSLANNHVGDYGDQALVDTVRVLRGSAIDPFGAGPDLRAASRAAVVERNGVRFGFLGFNAIGESPRAGPGRPGALSVRMPPRTGPLVPADLRRVARLVRELTTRVDVVVVLPHWGTQYTHRPEPVQRVVARRLVAAGADLVVGSHPHWVQGLDLVSGTVVAHSLGNFVFDMDFMTQTQQGVVLEATYWQKRLMSIDLVPYRMDARFAPRLAGSNDRADILGDVWSRSTGPFNR